MGIQNKEKNYSWKLATGQFSFEFSVSALETQSDEGQSELHCE
jgi:hypothetical protein